MALFVIVECTWPIQANNIVGEVICTFRAYAFDRGGSHGLEGDGCLSDPATLTESGSKGKKERKRKKFTAAESVPNRSFDCCKCVRS